MIGTAAAIALGVTSAVGAGAQIYGAKKASDASKAAAATQSRSVAEAMQYQRDAYRQAQQLHSPYLNVGNQSIGMLGRLLGSPAGARYAALPTSTQPMNMDTTTPMSKPYALSARSSPRRSVSSLGRI